MMETLSSSESSVNIYQTTWCNIPEGIHLHALRRENLKYHLYYTLFCNFNTCTNFTSLSSVIYFGDPSAESYRSECVPHVTEVLEHPETGHECLTMTSILSG
jgi:hypothetical protein